MNIRRLNALMRKEALQIIRDPSSILIAAVLPLLLIFIFAFAVSLDVNELAVGIAVEDDSPEAASFVEAFTSSRYFKVRSARDRRELVPALTAGDIRGIVVIPGDFASRLGNAAGPAAPVQIITDGSEPNTANFVQNYARGAWQVWLRQRALDGGRAAPAPVTVVDRVWYNPELESRNFLLPGALALIMTLIGTLLTALVVAREWERGTMEALLSTSITRGELILGKLLPYFLLGMLSLFLSVSAMVLLFHVPLRGSFLVLAGAGAVFLFTALGLGMLISAAARNQFVALRFRNQLDAAADPHCDELHSGEILRFVPPQPFPGRGRLAGAAAESAVPRRGQRDFVRNRHRHGAQKDRLICGTGSDRSSSRSCRLFCATARRGSSSSFRRSCRFFSLPSPRRLR